MSLSLTTTPLATSTAAQHITAAAWATILKMTRNQESRTPKNNNSKRTKQQEGGSRLAEVNEALRLDGRVGARLVRRAALGLRREERQVGVAEVPRENLVPLPRQAPCTAAWCRQCSEVLSMRFKRMKARESTPIAGHKVTSWPSRCFNASCGPCKNPPCHTEIGRAHV